MFCCRRLQLCCLEVRKGNPQQSISTYGRLALPRSHVKSGTSIISTRYQSTRRRKDEFSSFGDGSIFSAKGQNAWAHIFDDTVSSRAPRPVNAPRRQTMDENEKNIIRNLLDELYQTKQQQDPTALAKAAALREAVLGEKKPKHHHRLKAMDKDPDTMVKVDEMRQAIEDCQTKIDLYQWAEANVFSLLALDKPSTTANASPTAQEQHLFQELIPDLMRHFRGRFKDPNLALFIFRTVRHHSAHSYVLGCTAQTYNELMTTLWDSFRDLQGVRDTLDEMLRSSVEATRQTQTLAERICREAMDDKLWLDHTEEGDQVAIATISSISDLLIELMAAKSNKAGEWGRKRRDAVHRKTHEGELDFED